MLSRFSLSTINSQEILHLALGLVGNHTLATSVWALTKFSYSSFGVRVSVVFGKMSNFFLTVNVS